MPPRTPRGKARRIISTGVAREDSDDELGTDDLPWEWIYDSSEIEDAETPTLKRPRRQSHKIIAARMGKFVCRAGDCVLLKAEGTGEAWLAIICDFVEDDEGEMAANFMWFSTDKEIRNKAKKRTDILPHELYITPSWDVNPLASINGKAEVISYDAFMKKYPSGKVPRNSKTFFCRRGCNTRTATYTDEFVWEDVYGGGSDDVYELSDFIKTHTKATRSRRKTRESSTEAYVAARDVDSDVERTPKRQKKEVTTPRSKSRSVMSTPGSRKRIMVKKTLEFTPLATRVISPTQIQSSPFQLARTRLHVASVPTSLPCRENEFASVYSHLEAAIVDGTGSCIYIAGTPGTGKTATVREVISKLESSVSADELDDFIFVEINGMKITDPHQSYSLLWEALKGERVSPTQALDLLEREFNNPSPRRIPCVVLMDELDQLVTKNQSVMYNFFNWPALRHSRLIVLAVANTMDLPERTLSNKISSRLGLTRITFPGYNHEQLMKIIQSRLEGIPGDIVDSDAVQFASRKVAAVSGDARRALDICRRAVELAEAEAPDEPSTPSKKGRKPGQETDKRHAPGRVTIATIKKAINEATSNPIQQYLRALALTPRLLLIALLGRMQRSGTSDATFGDILGEIHRMLKLATGSASADVLEPVESSFTLVGAGRPTENYMVAEAMGIQASAVDLAGAGIIVLEAQRPERPNKLRLAIGDEEVRMALRDDSDIKALGISI